MDKKLPEGPISEEAMIEIMRQVQSMARAGVRGRWMITIHSAGDGRIRVQEALPPRRLIAKR